MNPNFYRKIPKKKKCNYAKCIFVRALAITEGAVQFCTSSGKGAATAMNQQLYTTIFQSTAPDVNIHMPPCSTPYDVALG